MRPPQRDEYHTKEIEQYTWHKQEARILMKVGQVHQQRSERRHESKAPKRAKRTYPSGEPHRRQESERTDAGKSEREV